MQITKNVFKWTGIIILVPTILSSLILGLFGMLALMRVGEGDEAVNFNYTIVYISAGVAGIGLFFYAMWFWTNFIASNNNEDFWKEVTELKEDRIVILREHQNLVEIAEKYKKRSVKILDREFALATKEVELNEREAKLKENK